jgi:hypothetical protein
MLSARFEPLPGVAYGGTMQTSDIYPAILGIGGIRTQDYTIPAFSDRVVARQSDAIESAATLGGGLFDTPAGWLTLLLLGLAGLVLYDAAR